MFENVAIATKNDQTINLEPGSSTENQESICKTFAVVHLRLDPASTGKLELEPT